MIRVRVLFSVGFLCLFLAPSLLLPGCNTGSEITAVPEGALVVDVRTVEEFEGGHYPGALNVPVDEVLEHLDVFGAKDRSIIVYCRSGFRSSRAKMLLKESGYTDVKNGGSLGDMMAFVPGGEKSKE